VNKRGFGLNEKESRDLEVEKGNSRQNWKLTTGD